MLRLIRREALAYLRLGLTAGRSSEVPERGPGQLGVLFVPGLGANAAQFVLLKETLREAGADRFDAFAYEARRRPQVIADSLAFRIEDLLTQTERLLLVGHSLGGVLLCAALQSRRQLPGATVGLCTLCSPLHGTWRSRLAPSPSLRELAPDSELMTWLAATRDRLDPILPRTLCVGARRDQFVTPPESAFLPGAHEMWLEDVAHAGSVLDPRVHAAVAQLGASMLELDPVEGAPPV